MLRLLVWSLAAGCALAAAPAQFQAWGGAGPELPPPPAGWRAIAPEPDPVPPLLPTADEQRRGYVIFARDPFAPVPPTGRPGPSERTDRLEVTAARGQYVPVSFAVHALSALDGVRVAVTAPSGIPADQLDLRVARCVRGVVDAGRRTYRLRPYLLERREAFAVAAGDNAQLWLTIHVPDDAAPGEVDGAITVSPEGREPARLPLRLRVLPFALPPAPRETALFNHRPPDDPAALRRELLDQREHGMNSVQPGLAVQIASRDRSFGPDDVAATQAWNRRYLAALREVFGPPKFPLTFEVGHQIAYFWDAEANWFAHWPHSPAIDADMAKAVDVIAALALEADVRALRVYCIDEAGAHNLLDEAVYYHRWLKEHYPRFPGYTTIGGGMAMGSDELGRLSPWADFLTTNRFTPSIARVLVDRGKPFGVYNGAGATAAGSRFFFGFYGWKTGATEISQWAYRAGDVFINGGLRTPDDGYVYAAADGPLPCIPFEAVRAGVDDARYLELLVQRIAGAEQAGLPAAGAAQTALRGILTRIPWTYQALKGEDRTLPPHPATLRKWRAAVIEQILKLPAATPAPIALPSPFDFEWAAPAAEALAAGPELFRTVDFEGPLAPWRVENWKGQADSGFDPAEHHGGARSLRIALPADAGANDVAVLVWPKWGDGNLSLALEGDHLYELSAWVKVRGRLAPPDLRLSLPAGAVRSARNGTDPPDDAGWQRHWLRQELDFHAELGYLAVWCQGPGEVWIDDLGLRELLPPEAELELDQETYDGQDALAVATLRVAKRLQPATVRLTLASGEKVTAAATWPFATQTGLAAEPAGPLTALVPVSLGEARCVFDPRSLAPGRYEARVELLDGDGKVLGSAARAFDRLP